MPLWEQVKGNLVEWYSAAADKTEEMAKIGVRRYDKFGISRDIERQFTELGSLVFNALAAGRTDFAADPTLQAIVDRIRRLEEELKRKEQEIEEIRQVHRERDRERAGGAEAAKLDPALLEGARPTAAPEGPAKAGGEKPQADADLEDAESRP